VINEELRRLMTVTWEWQVVAFGNGKRWRFGYGIHDIMYRMGCIVRIAFDTHWICIVWSRRSSCTYILCRQKVMNLHFQLGLNSNLQAEIGLRRDETKTYNICHAMISHVFESFSSPPRFSTTTSPPVTRRPRAIHTLDAQIRVIIFSMMI